MVIGSYASTLTWVATLWWICDWRPGRGRASLPMYRELVRFGFPLAWACSPSRPRRACRRA